MSKITKYYCDECGKEITAQSGAAKIVIFAIQGVSDIPNKFDFDEFKSSYWKHKEIYSHQLCEKCIGSYITVNCGDNDKFSIKDKGRNLLKKLGFIKI